MADEYATLTQLKAARRIEQNVDDVALGRVLTTASREIDAETGREPGGFLADGAATARTYRTERATVLGCDGELLFVDEISTLAGLVVEVGDGITWTELPADSYQLEPLNALVKGEPVHMLRLRHRRWAVEQARVTADWGWPAVPAAIVEATLLLANRLYLRKDSPEGVAGSSEWGVLRLTRSDPDVVRLISDYLLSGVG